MENMQIGNVVSRKDLHLAGLVHILEEKEFVWVCHYNNNHSVNKVRQIRTKMAEQGFAFELVGKDIARRAFQLTFSGSTAVVYSCKSDSFLVFSDFPAKDYMVPLFVFSKGGAISLEQFALYGNLANKHFIFDVLGVVLSVCNVSEINRLLINVLSYGDIKSDK